MSEYSDIKICQHLDIPQDFFNLLKDESTESEGVEVKFTEPAGIKTIRYYNPAVLYLYHRVINYYSMLRIGEYDNLKSLADVTSKNLVDMNDIVALDIANNISVASLPRNSVLINKIVSDKDYLGFYIKSSVSLSDLALSILNHPTKLDDIRLLRTA